MCHISSRLSLLRSSWGAPYIYLTKFWNVFVQIVILAHLRLSLFLGRPFCNWVNIRKLSGHSSDQHSSLRFIYISLRHLSPPLPPPPSFLNKSLKMRLTVVAISWWAGDHYKTSQWPIEGEQMEANTFLTRNSQMKGFSDPLPPYRQLTAPKFMNFRR